MAIYPAFIHQDDDKPGYGVTFPDFPGCVSFGDTIGEAQTMAAEALELHIERMMEDGEAIPAPSDLNDLLNTSKEDGLRAIILVPAKVKSKPVRINISIPEDVLGEIDGYAEQHGLTRSGFLVRAAQDVIKRAA